MTLVRISLTIMISALAGLAHSAYGSHCRLRNAHPALIMLCHPAILLAEIRQLPRAYSRACAGTTGVALG
ncbi:hypothetical protein KC359_g183 [Hortaea werneckii]|nr:hypothetical protein KC359_g183 [Hortaea werneckii]